MNKTIKTLGFLAISSVLANFSFAQTGYQVIDGDLYTDADPAVLVAAAPDGTVDSTTGALTIGGTTIDAPTATVLQDGSLDLGGGTILSVPALPTQGILAWFGDDLFDFNPPLGPENNQWYYSWTMKNLFHFAGSNFFYWLEADAVVYIAQDTAGGSFADGVWLFSRTLFPGQTTSTAIFVKRSNGLFDLRDEDEDGTAEGDGFVDGTDPAEVIPLNGFIYLTSAEGYTGTGGSTAGYFFFGEFDGGTYIWRVGDQPNAMLIQNPL